LYEYIQVLLRKKAAGKFYNRVENLRPVREEKGEG
jgi:hypothetical protein